MPSPSSSWTCSSGYFIRFLSLVLRCRVIALHRVARLAFLFVLGLYAVPISVQQQANLTEVFVLFLRPPRRMPR
jgi:hypothetical protein